MRANSYNEIETTAQAGIEAAAKELGASVADVSGYYVAGGEWDAETAEQLTDLIVTCWREQNQEV